MNAYEMVLVMNEVLLGQNEAEGIEFGDLQKRVPKGLV